MLLYDIPYVCKTFFVVVFVFWKDKKLVQQICTLEEKFLFYKFCNKKGIKMECFYLP